MTSKAEAGNLSGPPSSVREARLPRDRGAVRELFIEYRAWLVEHREVTAFDDATFETGLRYFDQEVESLPGEYGPPGGALFLAFRERRPIGLGALRYLRSNTGEAKRIYVRPEARGLGLGRRITRAILNRARALGYERVVLDTLPKMTAAIRVYRGMGFVPIPAYWAHPYPSALFFEYRFSGPRRTRSPSGQ